SQFALVSLLDPNEVSFNRVHGRRPSIQPKAKIYKWVVQQLTLRDEGVVVKMLQWALERAPVPNQCVLLFGDASDAKCRFHISADVASVRERRFGVTYPLFFPILEALLDGVVACLGDFPQAPVPVNLGFEPQEPV